MHHSPIHLAVHFLGGTGPTALYAHATGFHAHCWSPVTAHLPGLRNVGYDARGHGDTPIGEGWSSADELDWNVYGHDAALVAHSLSVDGRILGVGHSMGGAALLMAALEAPELFAGLVVYEPIVMPPTTVPPGGQGNFLAAGARRRRSSFDSFEAAIANYSAKPPMDVFAPEAVEAYVRHGFRRGEDGAVHLTCAPEHEARTYEAGGSHGTWERLPEVGVPVWVVSGRPEPGQPSERTRAIADRIPGASYVELGHLGHFGPMEAPQEVAGLVADAATTFFAGADPLHGPGGR